MTVAILDYGGGNLKSVANMLDSLGTEYIVTSDEETILSADRLIFPGVGHFAQVMNALETQNLVNPIKKFIKSGKPFMGICVGFQVLFETSEESPDLGGLGIFKGKVVKFTRGKIPQIGWNELKITKNNTVLSNDYVYFVNSYHVVPEDNFIVSSFVDYHGDFAASVEYKNVFGIQFHPEKSGYVGREIIKRWFAKQC